MLLDKLKAWQGDLKLGKDVIYKDNCEHEIKQYYHQVCISYQLKESKGKALHCFL